jgi:hypothetical protein
MGPARGDSDSRHPSAPVRRGAHRRARRGARAGAGERADLLDRGREQGEGAEAVHEVRVHARLPHEVDAQPQLHARSPRGLPWVGAIGDLEGAWVGSVGALGGASVGVRHSPRALPPPNLSQRARRRARARAGTQARAARTRARMHARAHAHTRARRQARTRRCAPLTAGWSTRWIKTTRSWPTWGARMGVGRLSGAGKAGRHQRLWGDGWLGRCRGLEVIGGHGPRAGAGRRL